MLRLLSVYVGACFAALAPPSANHIEQVRRLIAETLDGNHDGGKGQRYASVREMASQQHDLTPLNELTYGELSVPVLAELLDAVGMEDNDAFLDVGSGDGALVLGAAMLYPNELRIARGLELVPGLVTRSQLHAKRLESDLMVPVELLLGDVHQAHQTHADGAMVASILQDSTLAVCFATTWSADNPTPDDKTSLQGRSLPKLSASLNRMPLGSRILLIDGRLDPQDGYRWEGDMKIVCPDTAPFSVASLYERR
jgi:hypothetical protein